MEIKENPLGRKDELRGVSIFVDQVRMNGLVLRIFNLGKRSTNFLSLEKCIEQ